MKCNVYLCERGACSHVLRLFCYVRGAKLKDNSALIFVSDDQLGEVLARAAFISRHCVLISLSITVCSLRPELLLLLIASYEGESVNRTQMEVKLM
jgi:hypothetical protein